MFSWFSRRASSAGGNGVRGRGDGGCGVDWEGNDCSSNTGGDWGATQTVSTVGKVNSMGPTGTSGSAASTAGVPADTSGVGGISTICGGSTGGGKRFRLFCCFCLTSDIFVIDGGWGPTCPRLGQW